MPSKSLQRTADLSEDRLFSLGWVHIFKIVCAPSHWDAERVSNQATADDPPGNRVNRWVVSEPDPDRSDDFNGCNCLPCPDDPNRKHWLVNR